MKTKLATKADLKKMKKEDMKQDKAMMKKDKSRPKPKAKGK
jgi:hypothetical protein